MSLSPDQVNQIISLVSGLLTILVGALVRHYLPPRDGRPADPDDPAEPDRPGRVTRPPANPTTPKEAPATDE